MRDVIEVINKVRQAGVTLRADPPDLVIKPASRVPTELKARLKECKADVLRHLELEESMRRLESAHISIAVFEDGSMRVIQPESEVHSFSALKDGATVYSPRDMYHYINLSAHERRMLHSFKRTFGGTVE